MQKELQKVVIMRFILHQSIILKMFLVNVLSRNGYWYKLLNLLYVYALTYEVSNCSHKLKYGDTCTKYVVILVTRTSTLNMTCYENVIWYITLVSMTTFSCGCGISDH